MIEDAILFGQIGIVVCRRDKAQVVFQLSDDADELVPSPMGVGLILDSGAEAQELDERPLSFELVQTSLVEVSRKHRVLRAVLTGMDPELSNGTRQHFICDADELLSSDDLREFVRRRLLGCPFPSDCADLEGALRLAVDGHKARIQGIYQELQQSLEAIARMRDRWSRALKRLPLGIELDLLERNAVDSGLLADLTWALKRKEAAKTNKVFLDFCEDRRLNQAVPQFPKFLARLVASVNELATEPEQQCETEKKVRQDVVKDALEHRIRALRETFDSGVGRLRRRSRAREIVRRRGGHEAEHVLEKVQKTVDYITELMQMGRIGAADRALAQLIEFQGKTGSPDDLAKTLCALGTKANEFHDYDLSLRLYRYAACTGVEDPVVYTGRAETLRDLGRFDEALEAYKEAKQRFPQEPYAYTGRAETLRDLGRFDDALNAYDEARQRFPDNAVAYTGRAETLRDLGLFDDALKAYDEARQRFPDNAVAYNGRAETLRDLGRFDGALEAYKEAKQRFPQEPYAYSGRAETLRDLGRFDDALKAYDEARQRFPDNAVAYNGRAETLRDLGLFDDALKAYDEARQRFPDNAVAYNGTAETLRDLGRFDDALKAYDEARQRFPDNAVAYNGRAETLRDLGLFDDALKAYDEARQRFPDNAYAYTGRAETLRDLGRFDDALEAYKEARQRFPHNAVARNGLACVLIEMGNVDAAAALIFIEAPRSRQDWFAYHVLAMADLKRGRYAEAAKRLQYGAQNAPHWQQRDAFVNALALVRLRQREFNKARDLLARSADNLVTFRRPFFAALTAHAAAECGSIETAASAIREARAAGSAQVIILSDYLARRYRLDPSAFSSLDRQEINKLDVEIANREFSLALRAA